MKAGVTDTPLSVEHIEMLLNVLITDGEIEKVCLEFGIAFFILFYFGFYTGFGVGVGVFFSCVCFWLCFFLCFYVFGLCLSSSFFISPKLTLS